MSMSDWAKANLTLGNAVMIASLLIGIGAYYKGTEARYDAYIYRLTVVEQDVKTLKQDIAEGTGSTKEIKWKVDQLASDVAEIKNDVKATRRAVQ
jgi:peptidoglycan hydrolase CwlO-like protein